MSVCSVGSIHSAAKEKKFAPQGTQIIFILVLGLECLHTPTQPTQSKEEGEEGGRGGGHSATVTS